MKLSEQFLNMRKNVRIPMDKSLLISELEKAKTDWTMAQQKLDYVTEIDQIDYAIYALEAAEKRYEMLIREAKKMNLNALEDKPIVEE